MTYWEWKKKHGFNLKLLTSITGKNTEITLFLTDADKAC